MSKKANPALIGAFVVSALAVAVAALLVLGSGKFFKETHEYVLFFDGSLSGLDVGAPVECRGVRIGSVTRIQLQYDTATSSICTPVYIALEAGSLDVKGPEKVSKSMEFHIERGLRAQLQPQNLITGKLKIMLVENSKIPAQFIGGDPAVEEIPTIPMLSERIAENISKLPLADIVLNVNKSMESLAQFTSSSDLTNSTAKLAEILKQVDNLTAALNSGLPGVLETVKSNADQFQIMQRDVSMTLGELNTVLDSHSPERQQLLLTMRSIEDASLAMRDFLAYLQLHPESLISGKKED